MNSKTLDTIVCSVICEMLSKNSATDAFEVWKTTFDTYMNIMINGLKTNYLNKLDLSVVIDANYSFKSKTKKNWLASYSARSRAILNNQIVIGINYPLFYDEMRRRHIDCDDFNIEAQAKITIGHEIGHGLVDYIKSTLQSGDMQGMQACAEVMRMSSLRDEEYAVEEFGESLCSSATGVYHGGLIEDALDELIRMVKTKEKAPH